jgi:thiamine pyrophosphate-dependent acetolactate synthase large subunit-like protein
MGTSDTPGDSTRMTVYEALASDIKRLGVEAAFGLMSDDTALFCTTLDSMGVRFYGARHENNGISMAEGYAAATGKLGIAILGRGPATANALHGAVYAQRSGSKVLLVFGFTSMSSRVVDGLGPDGKAFNAIGVLEAAGVKTFLATDPENARRTLANAIAATEHGGCAALLLPMNVQFASIEYSGGDVAPFPAAAAMATRKAPRLPAIEAAATFLDKSRKPLFVAGLGAHRAGARAAIERLAEKTGAVIATTLKAKDMFRGHPYNLGLIGSFSHTAARRLIDDADCVVVFGAGLNQRTTSFGTSLPATIPLIHVDRSRSHIGRWFHADVAVIGDARDAAEQMLAAVSDKSAADKAFHTEDTRRRLADFDFASEFQPAHTPRTMDPRSLALELDRLLPPNRNAVFDTGNFFQIVPYISVLDPDHFKGAYDFSSIGMGFGTALGFARGTPDRTTVFFVGDGSFLMTMGELETVAREDLPMVIVLMNDCAYGAELHYLKMRDMPVAKSVFPDIDYAPVAEAFGFQAATVRTLEELRKLAPMLQKPEGPILLDCKINASVAAPFLLETIEHERRKN